MVWVPALSSCAAAQDQPGSVHKTYNIAADVAEYLKRSESGIVALDARIKSITRLLQQTSTILKGLSKLVEDISANEETASKAAAQFQAQLLDFQEMFYSINGKIESFDPKLHCQNKFAESLEIIVAEVKWRKDDLSLAFQMFELDLSYGRGG